jgi:catechol 2,3-dioxygenase-like lactoylglutathione lyase family enzyme
MHIDHTTIRTSQLDLTKDFLIKVFDMKEGGRPALIEKVIPGYWLYFEDKPLIHIIKSRNYHLSTKDVSAEAIDHTAFLLTGYESFKQKLIDLEVPFSIMDLEDMGERRIFFHTPTHILLETVFREDNAKTN